MFNCSNVSYVQMFPCPLDLLKAFSTLRATTGCFFPCPLYDRSGSQELDTLKTVANAGARQLEEPF